MDTTKIMSPEKDINMTDEKRYIYEILFNMYVVFNYMVEDMLRGNTI